MDNNNSNDDDNTGIILLFVGFVFVVIISVALYYFFTDSGSPGPSDSGSPGPSSTPGSRGGAPSPRPLIPLVNTPGAAPGTGVQVGGGSPVQNVDCQGDWNPSSTGIDGTTGCTQPCYDAAHRIAGTLVETFNVRLSATGTGRSCLAVAQAQKPGVPITQDPVTGEITTPPQPCNRNMPCMVNCSLSDTYSTIAGYGVGDSSQLCTTGLVPVEASFTVAPNPPFYNATCSFIVENAHAVDRQVCPSKPATSGGTCQSGYTFFPSGPDRSPPGYSDCVTNNGISRCKVETPHGGTGGGCYIGGSRYDALMQRPSGGTWYFWQQDNTQITSLTCPDGYTAHNPLSSLQCDPIGNWYTCPPGQHKVSSISAQNGLPSSYPLPGCAPN
jgi:hypothetical protein